jgi:hypothetical protein
VNIEDLMRHLSGITYDYIGGDLIKKAGTDADIFQGSSQQGICRTRCQAAVGQTARHGIGTDSLSYPDGTG